MSSRPFIRFIKRRRPRGRVGEGSLITDMIELARQYGRYGYRRMADPSRGAGSALHGNGGRSENAVLRPSSSVRFATA